jgi:Cro/C1-type HTH DNA-binding domain
MKTGVYVSRLGWVLRDRKLPVSELRRRLGQRGHTISRGALDRLMSERPLRTVDLDVLMPVLEELDVEFRAAFEHLPAAAVEAQLAGQPVARRAARTLGRRQALAAADAELRDAADRLEGELRRAHPELFDARGRLRQRALERLLLERVAGQQILEGDALRALLEQEERPSQPDAA